jgi:hypothetical protein
VPLFAGSCGRGFCDLGKEEEELSKSADLGTELEPAPVDI